MPDVRKILVDALEDVNQADVPADLRELAFSKAIDLHSGGPAAAGSQSGAAGSTANAEGGGSAGPLDQIAARVGGVSADVLADVYNVDADGSIELIIGPGKLSSRNAAATKEIALLLAAGRQGASKEDWTPASAIRAACESFKKLDASNFASTLKEMEDVFSARGSSRTREVKMSRPAWDQARGLIERFTA